MIEANIIHAAHMAGVQKLLFLGSSCIYPKHADQPMCEDALLTGVLEPTNEPYAIAKIAGIKLCESYNRQYGRDYRSVMPTNLYMVYGHGDHVDEKGEFLNRYPTQRPEGSSSRFANGCFICQPTVFFRRSMHVLLGDLNTNLKASFDFDYWLRAFTLFPDRIGFIDALQAQSRLHDACITRNARRTVAIEGVRVIARHLGEAPAHWIITYLKEVIGQRNVESNAADISAELRDTLDQLKGHVREDKLLELRATVARFAVQTSPDHNLTLNSSANPGR